MFSKKSSQYLVTLIHLFTNSHFTNVYVYIKVINEPNTDEAHHVLLPLLQWPSPMLIPVDHICGHTSRLITWNLCTSQLRCCLSHAWPQPPILPPLLTQQSLWAAQVMIPPLQLHAVPLPTKLSRAPWCLRSQIWQLSKYGWTHSPGEKKNVRITESCQWASPKETLYTYIKIQNGL